MSAPVIDSLSVELRVANGLWEILPKKRHHKCNGLLWFFGLLDGALENVQMTCLQWYE